jgi:hypothetical protein
MRSMIGTNLERRWVVGLLAGCALLLGALAGSVSASAEEVACPGCRPWWYANTDMLPRNLPPGGDGTIDVLAEDLGDAGINGVVTVTDRLPAGLKAEKVESLGFSGFFSASAGFAESFCKVVPEEVTCTLPEGIPSLVPAYGRAYAHIVAFIKVKVEGAESGEENEVSVSGGGASKVVVHKPITVSPEATPFGVEQYEVKPENADGSIDTQAGSHPFQLTTAIALNQAASAFTPPAAVKDLRFNLPPGLVGNPTPFPQCPLAKFAEIIVQFENTCPNDTAIGVASVSITNPLGGLTTFESPLFALVPSIGEPARFGFDAVGVPIYLNTSVRTGSDYGVTVTVPNITELTGFISSRVTFWGVPGDPRHDPVRGWNCLAPRLGESPPCTAVGQKEPPPLLSLPTSCTGPLHTTVEADSWEQEQAFTAPFEYTFQNEFGQPEGLDGCNQLPFTPSIQVTPDGEAGSTPTGLTVGLHVPQEIALNGEGLAEAEVKDTTVTLPAGVALNPAAADGLMSCTEAQIALHVHAPPECPEASKVGTVEIKSPLLPNPLAGAAYLAAQDANPFGSLVALYIYVEDPVSGTVVKLAGEVTPDPVTGQLVSTFNNTPQLPFEDFKLHFFGGDRAPLGTPATCGAYTTTASIAPWSGNTPAEPSSTFDITSGPNGSPCHDPLQFQPSLTVGTSSIQAGGFSPFVMTMSREDGEQPLQGITLHMPKGVSGTLSHVKLCGEQQADEGTCGPESQIGETIVSVGVGGDPYTVKGGRVYITSPYKGAPFGLSIVNPAKAGPYDLGQVIVRAKLEVDEETAAITVTTDNTGPYKIPTIIDGIPLQIRHVNVNIDRPGFTFNSTNCSPLDITGELVSTEGATSTLQVPYQVTNCAVLAFKPKLEASTTGKTSRANGASFHVKLGYPAGPYDANISRVKVELPKQLPSRLTTLQKACTAAVFNANPAACPAASIVGHATAVTPVLPVPLSGPAYFVSHGGEAFPSLVIVLQGYGVTVHLVGSTFINKAGVTSSTFKTVPDVPVGTFELTLPQGQFSALAATGSLCKQKLAMPTEFVGQNGALIKTTTKIAVTGCGKAKHKAKKASHKQKGRKGKRKK